MCLKLEVEWDVWSELGIRWDVTFGTMFGMGAGLKLGVDLGLGLEMRGRRDMTFGKIFGLGAGLKCVLLNVNDFRIVHTIGLY